MSDAGKIAIFYHPDGYDVQGRPLMGRRAAGKSFLEAWLRRRGNEDLYCCASRAADFKQFEDTARAMGANGPVRRIPLEQPEGCAQAGTLYYPGPDLAINAWRRYRRDPRGYSLMGVTHTICTKAVMDSIGEYLTAPLEDWDAVICTSQSVRQSVDLALAANAEHLRRRLGATKFPIPRLPIIPLGINTQDFAPDAALRAKTRKTLGIPDGDIAVLFVGRLSMHGKAHPAAMLAALERAANASGKKFHLILCGWFANASIEQAYKRNAQQICPSVKLHDVDGRDDAARNGAWRAGDIFVSLVDNIQETFGLTPVEAMAAGLPAVVSDWDGYRDTVRHGVDGFRIPTLMSPPAMGEALVDRYSADIDNYDYYLARSTYFVSVDVDAAAQAFERLAKDDDLRARMGAAGRERAVRDFDWQVILGRYEELAQTLGERRRAAPAPDANVRRIWPQRLSPFEMFANFTTRFPQGADRVTIANPDWRYALNSVRADAIASIENIDVLMADLEKVMMAIGGGKTIGELSANQQPQQAMRILALLLRLHKFGLVTIATADGPAKPKRGPADP